MGCLCIVFHFDGQCLYGYTVRASAVRHGRRSVSARAEHAGLTLPRVPDDWRRRPSRTPSSHRMTSGRRRAGSASPNSRRNRSSGRSNRTCWRARPNRAPPLAGRSARCRRWSAKGSTKPEEDGRGPVKGGAVCHKIDMDQRQYESANTFGKALKGENAYVKKGCRTP